MNVMRAAGRPFAGAAMSVIVMAAMLASTDVATAAIVPSPPSGLGASPYNGYSISVWWQAGNPNDSYIIQARRGGLTVGQATCKCSSLRLDGLAPSTTYSVWVSTRNGAGAWSLPSVIEGVTTFGAGAPDPPQVVSASSDPAVPTIRVSWTPPAGGEPAAFVDIAAVPVGSSAVEKTAYCMLPPLTVHQCGDNAATIVGLTPARQYRVYVAYGNASAIGRGTWSGTVTVASGCAGAIPYCINVDGTLTSGGADAPAAGLLHSGINVNQSRLQPLRISNWRLSVPQFPPPGAFDFREYESAITTNASITLVLSDAWASYSQKRDNGAVTKLLGGLLGGNGPVYATPPWYNWDAYSVWVTQYVRAVQQQLGARGWRLPDYWEVVNEPDALRHSGYFTDEDAATATLGNVELLFAKTYAAVKVADASARLLGPSLSIFAAYPNPQEPDRLDMATFLAYSDDPARPLRWSGLSWHEITPRTATDWTNNPGEVVANHAAAVRTLLAQHPNLGSPALIINEYGPPDRWVSPGWQVGLIDAVERADISQAAHSCFPSLNHGEPLDDKNCTDATSTLDGQLASDGATTYPIYWVGSTYATMSYDVVNASAASVVSSRSSHPTFGVFATRNPATSSVTALIGRHATCVGGLNADCTEPAAAPVDVPLTLSFPYSAPAGVRVRVDRIPLTHQAAPLAAPLAVSDRVVTLASGKLTVTLPQFADGDAIIVSVTPA